MTLNGTRFWLRISNLFKKNVEGRQCSDYSLGKVFEHLQEIKTDEKELY